MGDPHRRFGKKQALLRRKNRGPAAEVLAYERHRVKGRIETA
jgi:hypothetical protein